VSPRVELADGSLQTCGRGPWSPWRYARHYLHLVDETRISRWNKEKGLFQTYTINGACFLIKTEVFKKVGWLDERYFFTPEDIALGHALNDAGYTVWADADVSITHLAGSSVSDHEQAIKPARVRGNMLFYGEPFFLKCFIWIYEAVRVGKYYFLPHSPRNLVMQNTARNVMQTVFSHKTPKEIFQRFLP
jgi:GT2 family glycosyltransferase